MNKNVVLVSCLLFFSFISLHGKRLTGLGSLSHHPGLIDVLFQDDKTKASKSIKIINSEGGTYGYEIYSGGKLLIRQSNVPGMSGNKGFRRKSDAEKVAKLVVEKLEKGMMPPTVEKAELDKLKVQY